ncbi:hypothetical protein [Virgibacillus salexigens]|uniref:Uncharacterized protein n=1 Tax=Virgibacillus massiliensis TaxID=1462526 RepID=A0A024QHZ4_9BACI|nr:hypothetical protein [Virgibacillus massiliensis]CDQ41820.1 hypothetical protein BN990_04197 [Virgibacillus massiliensis]
MAIVRSYPGYPAFRKKLGVMPDFSGAKFSYDETPAGELNGTNKVFTLLHQPLPESLQIFKDGMFMRKNIDYTLNISNKNIIFSSEQIPQEKSVISANYKHY